MHATTTINGTIIKTTITTAWVYDDAWWTVMHASL
jgi:hypothetical protein